MVGSTTGQTVKKEAQKSIAHVTMETPRLKRIRKELGMTRKQLKLCRLIDGYRLLEFNPTQKELAECLNVTQPAVSVMLRTLANKGIIDKPKNSVRNIKLLIDL